MFTNKRTDEMTGNDATSKLGNLEKGRAEIK